MTRKKDEFKKRLELDNEDKVPDEILNLIAADKDWLRAFFTTESEYETLEFIQAMIYLMLYYFFFGYFLNIVLVKCYSESD